MTSWSSVVIRVLFEFVKIEVLFIASTRLFFIAKQRSTTCGGGGGHLPSLPDANYGTDSPADNLLVSVSKSDHRSRLVCWLVSGLRS